jgi:NADPH2:quinone reductase
MRAFQVSQLDQPPHLTTVADPVAGKGQVLVRIRACGLNFGDLLMIKGTYQERPPLPFTLGMEVAGDIVALGQGVTGLAIGDRIAVYQGSGGLADLGVFPADLCVKLPDTISYEQGAALVVAYGTSELALNHRANLQPGETLLVTGAAGGVGLTAVELGKKMGATVIACARGAAKLEIARQAGADHLIDSETDDITAKVKALGGADVVYEVIGGDQFTACLRATKRNGRILVVGFASGDVAPIPANIVLVKNIAVLGYYWGGYLKMEPQPFRDSLARVLSWAANGEIHPHVSHTLPIEQASDGLDLLRSRKSTGKVVITL